MIIENCKIVRGADGFSSIVNALKVCNLKHDLVWCDFFSSYKS
jgi:hypothetical protein